MLFYGVLQPVMAGTGNWGWVFAWPVKAGTGGNGLNELTGYVDLMVFHEIWSEHSLIDIEQNHVNSFILNTLLVAAFNATGYATSSTVKLDRSIKR